MSVFPDSVTHTTLDYLITYLRLRIGDTNSTAYRYLDEWLLKALQLAVQSLQRFWNYKYLIDDNFDVARNPNYTNFLFPEEDGVIEKGDENIIILMAAIYTLEGSLENSAWTFGSWKDFEVSYSNIEGGKQRSETVKRLWDELNSIIKPPSKRLATGKKGSLPGYKGNEFERKTRY